MIEAQGRIGYRFDRIVRPFMFALAGTVWEEPQRSHPWNTCKVPSWVKLSTTARDLCVYRAGDPSAIPKGWFRFHVPVLGGWRTYAALHPSGIEQGEWFVGWHAEGVSRMSRIPLNGPVRMLIGPGPVWFSGLDRSGRQIKIGLLCVGRIGEGGSYANTPLL